MEALIEELSMLAEDNTLPKNIRIKIEGAITTLKDETVEESIRANKALQELDDLAENPNIPSYIRPQIWNIVSQLETL